MLNKLSLRLWLIYIMFCTMCDLVPPTFGEMVAILHNILQYGDAYVYSTIFSMRFYLLSGLGSIIMVNVYIQYMLMSIPCSVRSFEDVLIKVHDQVDSAGDLHVEVAL